VAIGGLLQEGKTVSGSLREHELDFLFGEEQRKQIGSTAVVALSHQGLHGVLAIASRDPQHYKSSVGTLFLSYIAEVWAACCHASPLPALGTLNMERQLDAYCEHLRSERQVSPHTLRPTVATSTRCWAGASNRTSAAGRRWTSSVCAA
jgi:hypothetical protein